MTRWTDELLDELRSQGDPQADAVVAELLSEVSHTSPDKLMRTLVSHEVPPTGSAATLARYFAETPAPPPWVDPRLIRQGEEVFSAWGPQILCGLLCASLPQGYMARRPVQVLHLTARMSTDARRRIIETAQFIIDAMSPGGLEPSARGYVDVRRVRLMHAGIRHLISLDPRIDRRDGSPDDAGLWWSPAWGVPVNQEDLVGTLLTFTQVIFDMLPKAGVHLSRSEVEAYAHAWNYVGSLLGIREDLLPIAADEQPELLAALKRRMWQPSAAGREMMAALVGFAQSLSPGPLKGLPVSAIRHFSGDDVADALGVPPAGWSRVLFGPMGRVASAVSLADRHSRLVRRMAGALNRSLIGASLAYERGGSRPAFEVPDHLIDGWGLARKATEPLLITAPVSRTDIDVIAAIEDPRVRNLWISFAYHDFAVRLSRFLGRDLTWCAFAIWASWTAGSMIRGEEIPRRLRALLSSGGPLAPGDQRAHGAIGRVIERVVADVAGAVADGNTRVFMELGPIFADMLEAFERGGADSTWAPPPGCAPNLVSAFGRYRDAIVDTERRAELVLLGNLEAVLHEQERLQEAISSSLDAPVLDLVGTAIADHPRRAEVARHIERLWEQEATKHLMRLVTADEVLDLGSDVPALPGAAMYPSDLERLELPELEAMWEQWCPSTDGLPRRDWARLEDRMRVIALVFRSRQQHAPLLTSPLIGEQLEKMREGIVPDDLRR